MQDSSSQRGAINSRVSAIVIVLLVAAAVLGVVAYRQATNNDIDPELQETLDSAQCEFVNDENLCKFFASWETTDQYTLNATKNENGSTTTFVFRSEPDAFHLETSGDETNETIAIGNTVYIRDGDTWYEQTVEAENLDKYKQDNAFNFSEPASEQQASAYTATGTETCGEQTCLTYQVDGLADAGQTQIWFDDQNYQLRRIVVENEDASYSYDASVSYQDVTIEAPAKTTVLGEDQTIPPGQSTPPEEELPATGDQFDPEEYRQWLESRQSSQ